MRRIDPNKTKEG